MDFMCPLFSSVEHQINGSLEQIAKITSILLDLRSTQSPGFDESSHSLSSLSLWKMKKSTSPIYRNEQGKKSEKN